MKDIDIKCYSVTRKGVTTHLTNLNGITTNVITSKRMKQSRRDFNNWIKELRNSGYMIIDCNAKRGEFLNITKNKKDELWGINK